MPMCCCLTAKDKGEKKLFGYSFVPLMQEDGRTLPDGTHELIIHKVKPSYPHHKDSDTTTWNQIDYVLCRIFVFGTRTALIHCTAEIKIKN